MVFATCPAPGRFARLMSWLGHYLSLSALVAPFWEASPEGDNGKPTRGVAKERKMPTREELLSVIERFVERCGSALLDHAGVLALWA